MHVPVCACVRVSVCACVHVFVHVTGSAELHSLQFDNNHFTSEERSAHVSEVDPIRCCIVFQTQPQLCAQTQGTHVYGSLLCTRDNV